MGDTGIGLSAFLYGGEELAVHGRLRTVIDVLEGAATRLISMTQELVTNVAGDDELPYRVALDYLRALGILLTGYLWLCTARTVLQRGKRTRFCESKLVHAEIDFRYMMPEFDYRMSLMGAATSPLPHL